MHEPAKRIICSSGCTLSFHVTEKKIGDDAPFQETERERGRKSSLKKVSKMDS